MKVGETTDADMVELRLDYLSNFPTDFSSISKISKPVIATCMPFFEGGKFEGGEEERFDILKRTLPYVQYVTIELRTEKKFREKLIREAKSKGVRVIIAHHDFNFTPSVEEILKILKEEANAGADIAKVAFMARDKKDVLELLLALVTAKLKIPIIALNMGEEGRLSRILSPLFGGYLTYASPAPGKESAPGQYTVEETKKLIEAFKT